MAPDMDKLNAFIGQFVGDLGAAVHSGMVVIGEKLGLCKALGEGPLNTAELAAKTRTDERYVREWLGPPLQHSNTDVRFIVVFWITTIRRLPYQTNCFGIKHDRLI